MKKEITIPEATVTVETKFYARSISNSSSMYNYTSPLYDTYEEAVLYIAGHLDANPKLNTQFLIEAVHGRFADSE